MSLYAQVLRDMMLVVILCIPDRILDIHLHELVTLLLRLFCSTKFLISITKEYKRFKLMPEYPIKIYI